MTEPTDTPVLRVVRGGEPTDEELAALVVALTSRNTTPSDDADVASAWTRRAQLHRHPLPRGRDAWRRSMRP